MRDGTKVKVVDPPIKLIGYSSSEDDDDEWEAKILFIINNNLALLFV